MNVFWLHRNGKLYALKHDTFGHIAGIAGPLAWDELSETDDYEYRTELIAWAEGEIERHAMHRMKPAFVH
jgi:hypothetical protein